MPKKPFFPECPTCREHEDQSAETCSDDWLTVPRACPPFMVERLDQDLFTVRSFKRLDLVMASGLTFTLAKGRSPEKKCFLLDFVPITTTTTKI